MQVTLALMRLLLALLAVAVVTIAVACSDGDEPTLPEYFTQLQSRFDELNDRIHGIDSEYGDALAEEDSVDVYREFTELNAQITRDFADDLAKIKPPSALALEHAEAVEVATDSVAFNENLHEGMKTAESIIDVKKVLADSYAVDLESGLERSAAAWCALEDIAEDNDIPVDLGCFEPFLPIP